MTGGEKKEIQAMRTTIERTITVTNVTSGKIIFEKGLPKVASEKTDVFKGVLTDDKALKEVQKLYGKDTTVISKEEINDRYEISVEDFMKYATKVVEVKTEEAPATEGTAKTE